AGCNYFMGVPGGDDVMLSYQTTSYHDAIAMRSREIWSASTRYSRYWQSGAIRSSARSREGSSKWSRSVAR
ncbi:MAG: ethanolamine ammonia lyase large subunit, partial [Betaproteobacteria bacterium]|nr:ethanolamine ammonia lyase large subunit [Betaproteobacteria bacterium]